MSKLFITYIALYVSTSVQLFKLSLCVSRPLVDLTAYLDIEFFRIYRNLFFKKLYECLANPVVQSAIA